MLLHRGALQTTSDEIYVTRMNNMLLTRFANICSDSFIWNMIKAMNKARLPLSLFQSEYGLTEDQVAGECDLFAGDD